MFTNIVTFKLTSWC